MPLLRSGKSQAGKLYAHATSHGDLDGPKATFATQASCFWPFVLASGVAAGTLTNPGLQINAWICGPQPKLPPDSEPTLAPSA